MWGLFHSAKLNGAHKQKQGFLPRSIQSLTSCLRTQENGVKLYDNGVFPRPKTSLFAIRARGGDFRGSFQSHLHRESPPLLPPGAMPTWLKRKKGKSRTRFRFSTRRPFVFNRQPSDTGRRTVLVMNIFSQYFSFLARAPLNQ